MLKGQFRCIKTVTVVSFVYDTIPNPFVVHENYGILSN